MQHKNRLDEMIECFAKQKDSESIENQHKSFIETFYPDIAQISITESLKQSDGIDTQSFIFHMKLNGIKKMICDFYNMLGNHRASNHTKYLIRLDTIENDVKCFISAESG
jgi:hypothetical protein